MRKSFILPSVMALILFSQLDASATDVTAASCARSDVQAAVNACLSADGGTVHIPACSPNPAVWNGSLSVTATGGKSIRIIGAGQSATHIVGFQIAISGRISDIIELAHMRLDGNGILGGVTNTRYRPTTFGKEVYYHHLTVENYDSANQGAFSFEGWNGVVANVNMTCAGTSGTGGAPYGILVHGDGTYGSPDVSRLGSRNALFVEDSFFSRCGHTVVGMCDSHIVFRYNTVDRQEHAIDVHEPGYNTCFWRNPVMDSGDSGGPFELYNNIIQNPNLAYSGDTAFKPRGGYGIVANNVCNGFSSQNYCLGLKLGDYSNTGGGCSTNTTCNRCYAWDGSTNPVTGCYGCVQSPEKYYFWNNTCPSCNIGADVSEIYEDFGGNGCLRENTDYFRRAPLQASDGFTWMPFQYPHPLTLTIGAKQPAAPGNLTISP